MEANLTTSIQVKDNDQQKDARANTRYVSPLRYPGGKSAWTPLLKTILTENSLLGCHYYEPFAGGAGAALKLLRDGVVSVVHLNDADIRIYSLWRTVFNRNEQFAAAIEVAAITIAEWRQQLEICKNPQGRSEFEIAYATLYLNRCNRAGIILGSRPIGGMKQEGDLKIDARFNRETLATRIRKIVEYKDAVCLYDLDALNFLRKHTANRRKQRMFVYLDPPYYANGRRLYLNYYKEENHRELAKYMKSRRRLNWIMSYDPEKTIVDWYGPMVRGRVKVGYSLQSTRCSEELLITPAWIKLESKSISKSCSKREAKLSFLNGDKKLEIPVTAVADSSNTTFDDSTGASLH